MKMKKMLRCLIMLTIVVGVSATAFGAGPPVWDGSVDTAWNVNNNWTPRGVPTDDETAFIWSDSGVAYGTVYISTDPAVAENLLMGTDDWTENGGGIDPNFYDTFGASSDETILNILHYRDIQCYH